MSDETVHQTPHGDNLLDIEVPKSRRIRTLEQLLEAGQVDTAVWETTNFTLNKWEVAAKANDGESMMVEELFQVKASLRRKKLIMSFPTLRPLAVNRQSRTYKKPQYSNRDGIQTALILPDPHFGFRRNMRTNELEPFHDMRALDVALQVAYELRPHHVIHLGDILDLPDWSDKFVQKPDFQQLTQPAVIAANWWLSTLKDAVPGAKHVVLEGNHDKRLELAVLNHLKAAAGLRAADELNLPPALSVPRLLALHALGIDYKRDYPNSEYWLTSELMCVHGAAARKGGGKTTSALVKEYDVSIVHGHIHRVEQSPRTTFNGDGTRVIGAYSPGCLCHIDGRVPGVKARQDWQQGLAVAYFGDGIEPSVQLYRIDNGKCLFGGQMYYGADRTAVLSEISGWEF
jgi:predicted phosphodiesterase